ncbi:fumarylacetoacetate hydrolase family protein [Alphaproteobacteria bacterium]|jgi:2-keto-4-pentenoate hydratase/2-oxohepta-3-ene-1,7-dioic acid hydratase in catechol pathway|nr:fumarylacetoacetate hydrolase family protein [Alphaproteobacteria bacterium]|tara:strand:+ start:31 stop:879 length:849 start_codon:yes stop_codon:yes gene_type:complete
MKTLRYREGNLVKPGILDKDGIIRDASSLVHDWDSSTVTVEKLNFLQSQDHSNLPTVNDLVSIAPCVAEKTMGKFVCIGLNYSDHAEETGMEIPPEPVIFFKATSAVVGPNDDVIIPRNSVKSDWEVELGVIIGKEAKYISEDESQDHIAGYCVVNDLSEREFQLEKSGQWVKGKSCDTFGPIGPYLVTKEEIPDPQNLKLWLDVNGKRMQNGSTKTMVYGVNFLVSYVSQFMSLQPGDIISTGTPPGVGLGMKPQVYLKAGDVMELGIEGLGEQKQKTVSA